MSIQTKPNQYCKDCDKRVVAEKTTHRARNAGAVLGVGATAGLSGFAAKAGTWYCRECGSTRLESATGRNFEGWAERRMARELEERRGKSGRYNNHRVKVLEKHLGKLEG